MAQAVAGTNPLHEIGIALRKPEELVLRWRDAARNPATLGVLAASSIACLAVYGVTMGLPHGAATMGHDALIVPLCAIVAWSVSFPALYVINTTLGSSLDRSTTALAALVALHFGALARLASAPLSWFFGIAISAEHTWILNGLHIVVFSVTALCMADVFMRVMKVLEPKASRFFPFLWLCLVALIDVELKIIFLAH
jgi:hypothetical protein